MLFAFDLYDRDTSGFIDRAELICMLKDIYGLNFSTSPHARAVLQDIETQNAADASIGVNEFREFCRKRPALLFPAFQMQHFLQKKSLGTQFWEKYTNMRLEVCHGEYISVGQFMELHVNDKALNKYVLQPMLENRAINGKTLEMYDASGPLHRRGGSDKKLNKDPSQQ